ncbi:MAG: preprotein translocase subunit YajC [Thermoguttaceae bacterium]
MTISSLWANAAPAGTGGMEFWIILPAMLFLMWFLVIRPPQKQQQKLQQMLGALNVHDRVYTVGGIVGTIHQIDRDKNKVVLKVDDSSNVKVEFLLSAIAGPLPKE